MLVVRSVLRGDGDATERPDPTTTTHEAAEPPAEGGTSSSASTTPADTAPANPLASLGLQREDLPGKWTTTKAPATPLCPAGSPSRSVRASLAHEAVFRHEQRGLLVSGTVAEFADEDRAETFMAAVERGFDACESQRLETGRYELDPEDAPDLGDEGLAAHITATTDAGDLDGRLAYVREGRRVVTIYGVALDEGEFDEDVVTDALEAVLARL